MGFKSQEAFERSYAKTLDNLNKSNKIIFELGMENEMLKARLDWAEKHPARTREPHFIGRIYWPTTAGYCEVQPCHI